MLIRTAGICVYQINIDGKVLRGTAEAGKRTSGLCLVSAWVPDQGLSLGQVKVDEKSHRGGNEKTAIPELLATLSLENAVVSIDAVAWMKVLLNLTA